MNEYPIEDVHRMLEEIESVISTLKGSGPDEVRIDDLPEIFGAIHELDGWRNTADLQYRVGINSSLLNKFLKLRGTINRRDALKVADRLRNHLMSLDQAGPHESATPEPIRTATRAAMPASYKAAGEQWVIVQPSSTIKLKIAAVSSLLDSIVEQVKHANAPPELQVLTEIERQQLIAILETTLNVLKSPMVEKGLLKQAQRVLEKGARSAAERGVQQGLGKLMELAGSRIVELIARIFS